MKAIRIKLKGSSFEEIYLLHTRKEAIKRFQERHNNLNINDCDIQDYDTEDEKNKEHYKAAEECGAVIFY